ncbi:MAG TPA: ABC transporter substrate-binding protein [Thermodesulfobacteriota bacterium]|nr:ABC transporter substrate-binding protein [Thermodesulfobacteriota bacterium]
MKRNILLIVFLSCLVPFSYHIVLAAEPITIGVVTSLSHPAGEQGYNAARIAVDEINAKGGVRIGQEKRLINVVASDTRDSEPGVPVTDALLALEKTILEKKVKAVVVGPLRSEVFLASMDMIAKYKVPMLVAIAMTPDFETKFKQSPEKYKYVFRLCVSSKHIMMYLSGIVGFINQEFGFNKVYIMNQDVAWARGTAEMLTKGYFEKAGWTIVGRENYPTGSSDFSSGLMKVQSGGAQVVMPIMDMVESIVFVKQWKSMRIPAVMVGFTSRLGIPEAWKNFDGKIGGTIEVIYELGSAIGSKKVPPSMDFENTYEKRWGYPSGTGGHGSAPSYEAVKVFAEAIERAESLEADAVVSSLEKTNRMGVMGRIKFDEVHQVPYGLDPREAAIGAGIQWTETGSRVIVYPPTLAEGKIQLPQGLKAVK